MWYEQKLLMDEINGNWKISQEFCFECKLCDECSKNIMEGLNFKCPQIPEINTKKRKEETEVKTKTKKLKEEKKVEKRMEYLEERMEDLEEEGRKVEKRMEDLEEERKNKEKLKWKI
ncbi:hypothetical protein AVEN_12829-1 [Araneus ventricosus]|uniref:Uncharacterized protein n=1 Tax=Araneus ventricosus TaxID=182803 RepID=A0A4Y2ABP1_ARAVE|nr:hypothetical protein AVEN_12829-1 [Araneus ventricosus]